MNITFIGMPGSGKSTIGKALASRTGMDFVDVDQVIIRTTGHTLAEIIAEKGDDGFRQVENEVNASLELENSVISPGGSVCYGKEAMEHLAAVSKVVYLKVSQGELLRRLGDLTARGVSIKPGQTFADLYDERCPLYERYADLTVICDGRRKKEIVDLVCRHYGL